jgi:hypothetical protein
MVKKIVVGLLASLSINVAYAWGPVEQAALAAIAGGFMIGRATAEPVVVAPHPYYGGYPPNTIYVERNVPHHYQPRRVCYRVPLYDSYGRYVTSTRQCNYGH